MNSFFKQFCPTDTYTRIPVSPKLLTFSFFGRPSNNLGELKNISPKKILVMRYMGMGDTVLLSPFIKKIKGMYPNSEITFVTKPSVVNLYETCPYLSKIIGYEHNGSIGSVLRFAKKLRSEKYDLAFFVRFGASPWYANLLIFLSGAPFRVTYTEKVDDLKSVMQKDYDCFYTHLIPGDKKEVKHEIWRGLDILNYFKKDSAEENYTPRLELWTTKQDELFIKKLRSENGLTDGKTVVLGVGASTKKRTWPKERWEDLVGRLSNEYPDHKFVIIGDKNDVEIGNYLTERFARTCISLCGLLSLRQTYCLLKYAKLYIGNNSGPLHIASAASVPCIEISCHPLSGDLENSCSPARFGAWGVPSIALRPELPMEPKCAKGCIENFPHCICLVSSEKVLFAANHFLNREGASLQ
ncbi:MAG: putative ADP-heptose--LPS heptosyltransferase [Parcubacteria group bacterium LiPW_15]|nr:MAG: putative ADP-heptose--LPS heptosyltransferase [Parcubacteria group bacterium LiPW_15]